MVWPTGVRADGGGWVSLWWLNDLACLPSTIGTADATRSVVVLSRGEGWFWINLKGR